MLDKNFDTKKVEAKHYQEWEKSGIFAADVNSNKQPYCIPMPPPNVTGSLHIGHALTFTLQDILTRYERMQGKDVLWQPGTDHAGIATQLVVERLLQKEGVRRQDLGREKFLERVWEWKEESGSTITSQLRRLGATPDWERERFTMDEGLNKAVRKVFVQLYREKLIYRDKRLVNWDPKMHTAVSDLEVELIEVKGSLWYFKYPIKDMPDQFITVATTRPETMLGDTAVAVHPEDERYKNLVGKMVVLPITNREIPIVADDYADQTKGSGAVKITPAHDFNDFEVGKRHNLPMISVLDRDAKINENAPAEYQGMDRFDARKKIVADMEALGLLEKIEPQVHAVPHDEKSKSVVLEPFLSDQWYCDAHTLAQPAIKAVEEGRTQLIPASMNKTYFNWMNNIQPWCISRQLWWGHQIPAWFGPESSVFVAETEEEAYSEARAKFGDDVVLKRDDDVLDTWFSSALWPFSTLGWPEKTAEVARYYPAETLITGSDILFFWVARMMMMGIHFMGDVPFRKVYLHAMVRDEKGQKMSKTKGNVVDPLEIIDEFGTDAMRLTLTALSAQGRDVRLSANRVESYRNFATKLWNASRFCEMNECALKVDFDPSGNKHTLNRWIVSELATVSAKVAEAMNAFRFNDAAMHLYHFAWGSFCDWYIEFTKPLLSGDNQEFKQETRDTTGWVLDKLLLLLNPIMPYITEELHAHLLGKENLSKDDWLQSQRWPSFEPSIVDAAAQDEVNWVIRLISDIRSVRADMNVPAAAKIQMLLKDASAVTEKRLSIYSDIIKRLARLENISLIDTAAPKGSIQSVIDEATIILPIADVVDISQERARLQKEIEKVSANIEKINKMLNNAGFLAKAPEEVVDEQKELRREAEQVVAKLSQALKQIEAV